MKLRTEDGSLLDAEMDVRVEHDSLIVTMRAGNGQQLNPDYNRALEHLLQRLALVDADFIGCTVVSTYGLRNYPEAERVIQIGCPIRLGPTTDCNDLRIRITEGQRTVASTVAPGQTGGNKTKKIALTFELERSMLDAREAATELHKDAGSVSKSQVGRPYRHIEPKRLVEPSEVFRRDWAAMERSVASHFRIQRRLSEAITAHGMKPLEPDDGDPEFDVAWRFGGTFYVAEVKSLTDTNLTQQIRLGLGQVLHYRHALSQENGPIVAVLAVERDPGSPWAGVCSDVGVVLTWPEEWDSLLKADRPEAVS